MMDLYNRHISVQWVCGIAFFVIALTSMAFYLKNNVSPEVLPYTFAGDVILLIVSVPIVINSKIKASTAATLMSISYGMAIILDCYDIIQMLEIDELWYYISLILLFAGAAMVLFGIGLLLGFNYNGERLKFMTYITLAVICVPILLSIRAGVGADVIWSIKEALPFVLFLLLLMLALNSPEIRFYSASNRLMNNVIFIREVFSVAKDSWIYRSDFKRLINYMAEEWVPVGGPIIGEQVYIVHIYKSTLRMIIQKWDDGAVRLKVSQNRTDLINDKINMLLMEIIPDGDIDTCESFTIFGTDGMFIRLLVKEDKVIRRSKRDAERMMREIEPNFESGED